MITISHMRKVMGLSSSLSSLVIVLMIVGGVDTQQYSSAESYYACDRYYIGQLGSGVITHDNYPFNYTERLNCRHRFFIQPFHSSIDWKICFTFQRFRLTDSEFCSDDYLEFVTDGLKFCGNGHRGGIGGFGGSGASSPLSEPDNIFTSPLCWSLKRLNTFDILFNSRDDSSNLGFYANYTISYNTDPPPSCPMDPDLSSQISWSSLILPDTCQWITTECEADEFRCFHGATCIPMSQVCDKVNQCSDGSDESYDHARCPGKQDLSTCSFEPDGSGIDDGTCGMKLDGWILDTASPSGQWVDHTYRGVQTGRFLYSDYTKKDYVYANYTLPDGMLNQSVGTYCLRFHYYMSGSVGELSVRLRTGGGEWSIAWLRRGGQAVSWLPAEILIEPQMLPITEVSFQVYNMPSTVRSVGLDDISIVEGQCLADDISCTFSDGMCGWRPHLSTLSAVWERAMRVSPSRYTGPSSDHTNNNGSFLYMNGSEYQKGQKARLISSSVNQGYSGAHCLHFWYYMYGSGLGSLRVYTLGYSGATHEVWEKNGNQDRKWLFASVTLNRIIEPFQIILEGERGTSAMSDIAVDDIQLNPGYCDISVDYGGLDPIVTPSPGPPGGGDVVCGGLFELRCATVDRCYHRANRCDGIPDCDDHSDEENCTPAGNTGGMGNCAEYEVRCVRSLTCVHRSQLCDGRMDCEDGSDEFRCKTGGGLMSRHMDAGVAPSVIIGSVMAAVIILVIIVLAFVIIIRRRSARRGRTQSPVLRIADEERNHSPSLMPPSPVSPPKYSDLIPPPYVLLDDKDGGSLSPPSYEVASAAIAAADLEQQQQQLRHQQPQLVGQAHMGQQQQPARRQRKDSGNKLTNVPVTPI